MNIKALESWYLKHQRELSFRKSNNPYHIWVSEVMLQQTQVDTVIPYFDRFIKVFPTLVDLAKADEEFLIKQVEGLGYYRRFRNMHKAAKLIAQKYQGLFPNTYQDVLSLPGIGHYTAGAIMSIAYGKPYSATDGNVIRVLSRYLGDDRDFRLEKNKRALDRINQNYIEKSHPEIYTQALMELGATLCKPSNPICDKCPLQEHCVGYQNQMQHMYPNLSKLSKPKPIHYIVLIVYDKNHYYLTKRSEELLKGMYAYPQYEFDSVLALENYLSNLGVFVDIDHTAYRYKHTFSHQIWHMEVHYAKLIGQPDSSWIKLSEEALNQIPMAVAHRKIKR
ncbi:MAG: A/G-specific adenine glycosylase [Acholeplasmataceae bacterium]